MAEQVTLAAVALVGIERHQVFLFHKAQRTQLLLAVAVHVASTTLLRRSTDQILFLAVLRQQVAVTEGEITQLRKTALLGVLVAVVLMLLLALALAVLAQEDKVIAGVLEVAVALGLLLAVAELLLLAQITQIRPMEVLAARVLHLLLLALVLLVVAVAAVVAVMEALPVLAVLEAAVLAQQVVVELHLLVQQTLAVVVVAHEITMAV